MRNYEIYMSCLHPLKAFKIGVKENGKDDLRICSFEVDHLENRERANAGNLFKDRKGQLSDNWVKCFSPEKSVPLERVRSSYIEIPCGQCVSCRLDYSRLWADRMMLEMPYHKHNWFITLTYDDEHVPINSFDDNGELIELIGKSSINDNSVMTLKKKDYQDFLKRLRKYASDHKLDNCECRYFLAGEYGDNTRRPHYHLILFGFEFNDLEVLNNTDNGPLYTSATLQKIWSNGNVSLAEASWQTCNYVARYVLKKQKGTKETKLSEQFGFVEPFVAMSTKPAIGKAYYDDNPDLFNYEHIFVCAGDSQQIEIPRYFKKLKAKEDDNFIKELSDRKVKVSKNAKKNSLSQTDLNYSDYLKVKESKLLDRIGSIKHRKDI